jgi:hypothetical protein
MKRITLFFFLSLLFFGSSVVFGETTWGWFTLFPERRLVPPFPANPTAHQFSAGQILKNRNVISSMGGILPVANVQWDWFAAQLSVGSSVYAYLNPPDNVNLVTADFYVDFVIIDIPLTEKLTLRVAPGHTSHHLSDNAYAASGLQQAIDYIRDYWEVFAIYRTKELKGFVYGGAYYNYTYQIGREIHKPWLFEIGGEFLQTRIVENVFAYGGIDIKLRDESHYATTQNYQIGVRFLNGNGYSLRLALNLRTGVDERGQFVKQHDRFTMLAAYIDI